MDLRIKRTRKSIKEAFAALRGKKPIEKISVTELSQLAGINKATFYLHYSDIYALASEIEDEAIDAILSETEIDHLFEAPRAHMEELFSKFLEHRDSLKLVFSGSRSVLFALKIEQGIKSRVYAAYPEYNTPENDVLLTFMIQGSFHTIARLNETGAERESAYALIMKLVTDTGAQLRKRSDGN